MPKLPKKKIVFLVGPTCVGKSAVAVKLARLINAEIVSCDSMQIYKGMDILTSKMPKNKMAGIAHHLISILNPQEDFDVAKYRKLALEKISTIIKKKKIPLLVGGTGLYVSILIDGIFQIKLDKKVRLRLYKEAEKDLAGLYSRLNRIDPPAAQKIHPQDKKRIIRALEVFECTGKPISELYNNRSGLSRDYDLNLFSLSMERSRLYDRIDQRVDRMFSLGLVKEVRRLLKHKLSRTACYAIGIREIKGYLDGKYDIKEAERLIKRNTRHYAKRQLSWFKRDKRIKWFNVKKKDTPFSIAKAIWKKLS
jgi:tRNA dimethylallyltransferase